MSFTSLIKSEVSKVDNNKNEQLALLSSIVHESIIEDTIKITTENASVARLVFQLFKDVCQLTPKIIVRNNYQKHYLYMLEINNKKCLEQLGIYDNKYLVIPPTYLLDDDESIRSYLRGVFLMGGSINDPKKSRYHLEILVVDKEYAEFIKTLLNQYHLNSKVIKRDSKYMVYIKEAEKIGDFLRIIKASSAVLYYEDIRIYRDHKNMTNRLNNCEQANMDRIIKTATEQVNNIEIIINKGSLDLLDDKEKLVANYRLKYKDVSLDELCEIIAAETDTKLTKSGLYHRFKKIKDLAERLK